MAQALAGAGKTTRNGGILSSSQISRILDRLSLGIEALDIANI
jgi:hypothetical protein